MMEAGSSVIPVGKSWNSYMLLLRNSEKDLQGAMLEYDHEYGGRMVEVNAMRTKVMVFQGKKWRKYNTLDFERKVRVEKP